MRRGPPAAGRRGCWGRSSGGGARTAGPSQQGYAGAGRGASAEHSAHLEERGRALGRASRLLEGRLGFAREISIASSPEGTWLLQVQSVLKFFMHALRISGLEPFARRTGTFAARIGRAGVRQPQFDRESPAPALSWMTGVGRSRVD